MTSCIRGCTTLRYVTTASGSIAGSGGDSTESEAPDENKRHVRNLRHARLSSWGWISHTRHAGPRDAPSLWPRVASRAAPGALQAAVALPRARAIQAPQVMRTMHWCTGRGQLALPCPSMGSEQAPTPAWLRLCVTWASANEQLYLCLRRCRHWPGARVSWTGPYRRKGAPVLFLQYRRRRTPECPPTPGVVVISPDYPIAPPAVRTRLRPRTDHQSTRASVRSSVHCLHRAH